MAETFDLLERDGAWRGVRKAREAVHRDGDWHAALHLWLIDEAGRVLFQRRAHSKDLAPGKVDIGVAGHLSAGETWREALREAQEEVGLWVAPECVVPLLTLRSERSYADGRRDFEFQQVFVLRVHAAQQALLQPNASELMALYWLPISAALALVLHGEAQVVAGVDPEGRLVCERWQRQDLIAEGLGGLRLELRALQRWWQRAQLMDGAWSVLPGR